MENIDISNFVITMLSTAIGVIVGGLVTLIVNKKFEIIRIRINNINDMKNDVTPALQQYVRALKSARGFLFENKFYEKLPEQKGIILELENALSLLNEKVDTYEIELSNMLEFHELILEKSFLFFEKLKDRNMIEDPQSNLDLKNDLDVLVDMVATFNEEVSEIKRDMLRGNIKNYWRKDIFIKEKNYRINYHNYKG